MADEHEHIDEMRFDAIEKREEDDIRWHERPDQHLSGIGCWPPPKQGTFDLAEPGMFSSEDKRVVNWAGENYYLACGVEVSHLPDGGMSSCVKRLDHPGDIHEDFDGRTHDAWEMNLGVMGLGEAVETALDLARFCWVDNRFTRAPNLRNHNQFSAIYDQLMARIRQAGPIYD